MCAVADWDVIVCGMFWWTIPLFVAHTIVILISFLQDLNGYGPPRTFGLYKLVLKEVKLCSELKRNFFSIKVNYSNNGVINYAKDEYSELEECCITLVSDFNDDISGVFSVYMLRQDGGWSLLHGLTVPRACSDTALAVPELLDILLTTAYTTETCSVPKGNYSISKMQVKELKISKFPDLPYSKYKINLELFKKKSKVGCVTFVVDVLPQENKDLMTLM